MRWWDRIWALGASWLTESDAALVRVAAESLAERERLRAFIAAMPVDERWYQVPTGQINTHPSVAQLRTVDAQVMSWLQALGFTPQARAQLKLGESEASKALADLRSLREAKRA